MDETYLKVGGRWAYLYRAIDRDGNLVDTMLSEHRDMAAAQAFFRSEFENELPSGTSHGVEYMSAVATWYGFVSDGDAALPMDGNLARPQ